MNAGRATARERGQALVEFAFVGFALALLVLGMFDVGRAVWNYNTLAHATREGTRYAMVHGASSSDPWGPGSAYFTPPNTDTKVRETVEESASGIDTSRLTVEAEWLDGTNAAGTRVKVTSHYSYDPVFDFFGIASFTMNNSSTMEITH